MTLASFQLPGLACFGGGFLSLILPKDCGRGVTDFLVEATLMVASSSAGREKEGGQHVGQSGEHGGVLEMPGEGMVLRRCGQAREFGGFESRIPLRESIVAMASARSCYQKCVCIHKSWLSRTAGRRT